MLLSLPPGGAGIDRRAGPRAVAVVLLSLFTIAMLAAPARADDPLVMKFGHVFPSSHYGWVQGGQVFADQVVAETGGALSFKVYPAGQLGKDYFALLRSGLIDMSVLVTSYEPEKLPLSSVVELPGLATGVCAGTEKLWSMARPGGILDELELNPLGIRALFVIQLPPYAMLTSRRETPSVESLSGLKIRANGAAMDMAVRALGAVPVHVTGPEAYDALWRGTVDGAIYPYHGLQDYDLQRVLMHSANGANLGAGSVIYGISLKTWNSLSVEVQDIMMAAGQVAQTSFCQWLEVETEKAKQEIVDHHDHNLIELSAAERARWNQRLRDVPEQWARRMDAVGKPGTRVLREFQRVDAQSPSGETEAGAPR